MTPSNWTVADWITVAIFAAGAMGAILKSQHMLITGLLRDKWDGHEKRISDAENRLDDGEEAINNVKLKVNTLETVCRLRQETRNA